MSARLRLAVIADFREEGWTSMELVTDMLLAQRARHPDIEVTRIQPAMLRVASRIPTSTAFRRVLRNSDRALGRYVQYPLQIARLLDRFDAFHVADHSYAHLALLLPREVTGVYCHDIDAFRAALPSGPRRALPLRALARVTLAGLQRAAVVFHSTMAVRREIEEHALVESQRLVHAPYGVAPEFSPPSVATPSPMRLLHVGQVLPRKNPEFLLKLVARLRRSFPELTLLQVGGTWLPAHLQLIRELGLEGQVEQVRGISRADLAEHYRTARAVLVPSRSEGFGLPVTEALACGAVVFASDIPVLREPGGSAVVYCPVDALDHWEARIASLLRGEGAFPEREARLEQAARFSWDVHARTIFDQYRLRVRTAPRSR